MTGTLNPQLPEGGEPRGTADSFVKGSLVTLRDGLNAILNSENKVARSALEAETTLHSKVIATEESRENSSYGTLTTADEITGIVLPTNGLILIRYTAAFKSSVASQGTAALFLGSNQIKDNQLTPVNQECATAAEGGAYRRLVTIPGGLGVIGGSGGPTSVTTGQLLGRSGSEAGAAEVFAAAGTYTVSVKYKATTGTVTAKERKLWVEVLG